MSNNQCTVDFFKSTLFSAMMINILAVNIGWAQSLSTNQDDQRAPILQNPATPPLQDGTTEPNKPPRKIHRIGTVIDAPRNSVSIKSTDAGSMRRQPPKSTCTNCGIIDFINRIGQGNNLNAIASGVVAGTIAREVIRYAPQSTPYGAHLPHLIDGVHGHSGTIAHPNHQYHIGVTMSNGSQAIIALPDASHLQQGDRVQLIDGTIVVDRQ